MNIIRNFVDTNSTQRCVILKFIAGNLSLITWPGWDIKLVKMLHLSHINTAFTFIHCQQAIAHLQPKKLGLVQFTIEGECIDDFVNLVVAAGSNLKTCVLHFAIPIPFSNTFLIGDCFLEIVHYLANVRRLPCSLYFSSYNIFARDDVNLANIFQDDDDDETTTKVDVFQSCWVVPESNMMRRRYWKKIIAHKDGVFLTLFDVNAYTVAHYFNS